MHIIENSHRQTYENLLNDLAELTDLSRVSEGLLCAAGLIEASAYAQAHFVPGDQTAGLILLAARVEREANRIEEMNIRRA